MSAIHYLALLSVMGPMLVGAGGIFLVWGKFRKVYGPAPGEILEFTVMLAALGVWSISSLLAALVVATVDMYLVEMKDGELPAILLVSGIFAIFGYELLLRRIRPK